MFSNNFMRFLSGMNAGSGLFQMLMGNYWIAAFGLGVAVLCWPWGKS